MIAGDAKIDERMRLEASWSGQVKFLPELQFGIKVSSPKSKRAEARFMIFILSPIAKRRKEATIGC